MNRIKINIDNLISLWKTGSEPFQTFSEKEAFAYCHIPESQWPNRIWLINGHIKDHLSDIVHSMGSAHPALTFSHFDQKLETTEEEKLNFLQMGLSEKSIQYGMSYIPGKQFDLPKSLHFKRVIGPQDIKDWCHNFQQAFRYQISELTLEKTINQIEYYNIVIENNPIGTVLLHQTSDILGIHSLGINPDFRGNGFAKEAMQYLLNLATKRDIQMVTLQASVMAKKMYENLGFTTDFIMRNYQLKN